MPGLLADLNEAQREAVTHPGGPLLVLAGAGTGKTRVITRRIAWLASQGTAPEQVLALTFSTKAAEEMRARAEELLDERLRGAALLDLPRLLRAAAPRGGARTPASIRSFTRSLPPSGSRCCSTASTSSRCAITSTGATRRRCWRS